MAKEKKKMNFKCFALTMEVGGYGVMIEFG
jgi:hypothetical protein